MTHEEPVPSPSSAAHRRNARQLPPARVAVVTVSDTRTRETDISGDRLQQILESAGHQVTQREIVRDEPLQIRQAFDAAMNGAEVDAIVFTGGTGISPRDGTVEVIRPLLEKELPGFGEIFRMLSWHEIGPPAILSRATAGLIGRKAVFCLPGSQNAVELAATKLIAPELAHLLWEARR